MTAESLAKIKIDPARTIGAVDPRIYGGFTEHLSVTVVERPVTGAGQDFTYSFPAHSLTVLRLELRSTTSSTT
jgi:hypothetical protein